MDDSIKALMQERNRIVRVISAARNMNFIENDKALLRLREIDRLIKEASKSIEEARNIDLP